MKVRRLEKLPKRKLTIDELLGKDDLLKMAEVLKRDDLTRVMLIYITQDGNVNLLGNGQTIAQMNFDCDQIKRILLTPDEED